MSVMSIHGQHFRVQGLLKELLRYVESVSTLSLLSNAQTCTNKTITLLSVD